MDTPLVYVPHMSRLAGLTLETTVAALSVVTQPSATVVEGQPFATPPRIRVTDEHGNGIAGKRVYAIMYSANGYVLPNLYYPNSPRVRLQSLCWVRVSSLWLPR